MRNWLVYGILLFCVVSIVYEKNRYSGPTDEELRNASRLLPHGCIIINLGKFGGIKNLVVIECTEHCSTTRQDTEEAAIVLKPIF